MVVFISLGMQPRREVEKVKDNLILDEDESIVFDMAIRNRSAQEMAFAINKSPRTVFRIMAKVRSKILNYYDSELA